MTGWKNSSVGIVFATGNALLMTRGLSVEVVLLDESLSVEVAGFGVGLGAFRGSTVLGVVDDVLAGAASLF